MKQIRSSSTMWRATCNFPTNTSDIYRDYMRAKIRHIDILQYKGSGKCFTVDFIDIRGHAASTITVPFWQEDGYSFHTDSSHTHCQFNGQKGCVPSEDNFGSYSITNGAFRCTETKSSTTQYWFGAIV